MCEVLNALLGAVGAADVYAGIGVGDRSRAGRGSLGHRFLFRDCSRSCVGSMPGAESTVPKAAHCSTFNRRASVHGGFGSLNQARYTSTSSTDAHARSRLRAGLMSDEVREEVG